MNWPPSFRDVAEIDRNRYDLRCKSRIPAGTGAQLSIPDRQRGAPALAGIGLGGVCALVVCTALTAALGAAPASAHYYGYYRGYYGFGYGSWHRPRHRAVQHPGAEAAKVNKEPFGDIPKGPLQIFISIDQQKLHLYSDGTHVADTSVATGVPHLPTPLGVFSIIQKQVFHRSNIYSNAPMPFMQRITWSGVAMHEGEGIGHRASHGCIRMPRDFAVRLYHLTRLGVPVFIANKELKPADFADPHLFVHRDKPPEPPPAAAPAMSDAVPPAPAATANPATLGLRVGGNDPATPATAAAPTALADAAKSAPSVNDAAPSATVSSAKSANDANAAPPVAEAAKSALPDNSAPQSTPPAAKPAIEPNAAMAPAAPMATAANVPGAPAAAALDPAVPMPPAEPANLIRTAPASKAPIAIFISRKAKKIYVRQDFAPLFQAPVTIADPEKPLGTLVFTALGFAGTDRTTLRWNVVEFPAEPPKVKRRPEREMRFERYLRGRRREEIQKPADLSPPETPAEALARITIPQEATDYISQLIVPGSTLIISDHGLGDETGEGTNFIVVTR
jgi:hypothetical protein